MMLSTNDLRKACEIPNDASLGQLARQQLPLLADHIETLYRAIAASRALVAEKDKALDCLYPEAFLPFMRSLSLRGQLLHRRRRSLPSPKRRC